MVALSRGNQLTISNFTITPTHDVHHVAGEFGGHLSIINVPSPSFCGFVILIWDGTGVNIHADGNIAFSGNQPTTGRAILFVYDPTDSKWYAHNW